ncbi:MAG: glutaredoxin domain-containing protein [Acidimicrobiales bacterium]
MSATPSAGSATPDVTVYWRPGCGFCSSLRRDLARRDIHATWINIWEDDEARAFVRSVARGHETVPTAVVDGLAMVNPRGSDVQVALETAHERTAPGDAT